MDKIGQELENQIVDYLYHELQGEFLEFFKKVYAEDGNFYSVHHGAGTHVRNLIRERFPKLEAKVGNLDDVYCDFLLKVITYRPEPIAVSNRLEHIG